MGRNLNILAATLGLFGLLSIALAYTGVAHSAGDKSLWRTMGLGLVAIALLVALFGNLSAMFEQAERRDEERRRKARRR